MAGLTRASTFFAGSFLQRWTDCRVISAFTRVFDALLPGNDGGWIHTQSAGKTPSPPAPRASSRDSGTSVQSCTGCGRSGSGNPNLFQIQEAGLYPNGT